MTATPDSREILQRANEVMQRLTAAGRSLVTAESCSGGLVCALLSGAEGAGRALHGGFAVYTKEQKSAALGIPLPLLRQIGSVETDIARRMVEGALARSEASVALAVTGVLGPTEDEDGNPVGRVIFAAGLRDGPVDVEERRFGPMDTDELRHLVVLHALAKLEGIIAKGEEGGSDKNVASRGTSARPCC